LSGRFNIYNYLAALGVGLSKGFKLQDCVAALAHPPIVPGRLERVENGHGILVFVDHAHKPGALESVLESLMEIKKRKVITVFGCGGDRDPYKRPMMASAAEKYSDRVIVTSDNPRTEDPLSIIGHIVKGFAKKGYVVEPDRKKAIGMAIDEAAHGDIVLLAGKGHEDYQIFANQSIPFNDRLVAKEFLDQK
jgi:UDP-N-acetylmuramoyl-L-alanyl-D-glutamate--2,6-diaminopimelate ligase